MVNPSGGLISKGHPLGATGPRAVQRADLAAARRRPTRARSTGATVALQHNIGLGGAAVVTVYKPVSGMIAADRRAEATSSRRSATSAPRECGTREQRDALTGGGRHPHNQELYKKMADLGWLGVAIPEEYGGSGGGLVDLCLFLEETARGQAADRRLRRAR